MIGGLDTVIKPSPMQFEAVFGEVVRRSRNVKSFRFEKPKGFDYLPGQFMNVFIRHENGIRKHHFTISSSPTEDLIEFTKMITDHEFSVYLDSVKGGEWALIDAPYGDFFYTGGQKFAALTGGIGITPIRSMARFIADAEKGFDLKVLYSNHTQEDIIFREEFDSLMNDHPTFTIEYALTRDPDWKGLKGHIDAKMIKESIPDLMSRTFMICGPPKMVSSMVSELRKLNVPDERIRTENFPGY